jgi:hypothetical protein
MLTTSKTLPSCRSLYSFKRSRCSCTVVNNSVSNGERTCSSSGSLYCCSLCCCSSALPLFLPEQLALESRASFSQVKYDSTESWRGRQMSRSAAIFYQSIEDSRLKNTYNSSKYHITKYIYTCLLDSGLYRA